MKYRLFSALFLFSITAAAAVLIEKEDFSASLTNAVPTAKSRAESFFKGKIPANLLPVFAGGWDAHVFGEKKEENGQSFFRIRIRKTQTSALRFRYLLKGLAPGKYYRLRMTLRNTPKANLTIRILPEKEKNGTIVPGMEIPYQAGWRTYSRAFFYSPESDPRYMIFWEFSGPGTADLKNLTVEELSEQEFAAAKDKIPFTRQPDVLKLPASRQIPDPVYDYLIRKPFLNYDGKGKVVSGFIGFTHRPAYQFYGSYFKQGLPETDFLDLRGPVHFVYCKTPEGEDHMTEVLEKAAAVKKIRHIQFSLRSGGYSDHFLGPEWEARDLYKYLSGKKGFKPVCMKDQNGVPTCRLKTKRIVNYSRFDQQTKNFLHQAFRDTVRKYKNSPYRIDCWHFGWPNENDWWVPINNQVYDYSEPAQEAFRSWLCRKYRSLAVLNAKWGTEYANWKGIAAPKPQFNQLNLRQDWQDWQDFRFEDVMNAQQEIIDVVRKEDPDVRILYWMTSGISTAGRDQILPDNAMRLARKNKNTLAALTCIDFYDLNGELFGQLAEAYGTEIGMEPVHQDYRSFLRSFYNSMRFPVRQLNWLFQTGQNLKNDPQIIWVMNQRGVLKELAEAKLIQNDAAVLFSYSDVTSLLRNALWHRSVIQKQIDLLHMLQDVNIPMGMITDHSIDLSLSGYQTILIPEIKTIRPAMTAKLTEFIRNGGTVLQFNAECGAWNLESGKKDYPLLNALKICSAEKSGTFKFGKGRFVLAGTDTDQLRDRDGQLTPAGIKLLKDAGIVPFIEPDRLGVASFIKKNGETTYLGLMNMLPGEQKYRVRVPGFSGRVREAVDLYSGRTQAVKNGTLDVDFQFRYQSKVFRIRQHPDETGQSCRFGGDGKFF